MHKVHVVTYKKGRNDMLKITRTSQLSQFLTKKLFILKDVKFQIVKYVKVFH